MVSRLILLFCTLAILASSRCPQVSCDSLDSNTCAKQTAIYSYSVNNGGCNSGYTCSLAQYLATVTNTASQSNMVSCTSTPTSTSTTNTWSPKQCQTKLPNRDWNVGGTLLLCQVDGDCLMQDGTYASCVCVPRSDKNGVCQPDVSNQAVFAQYWLDCGSTNVISEEVSYVYWTYAISNWAYAQSDLSCSNIFYEVGLYKSLKGAYDSGAGLAIVSAALLFLG